MLECRYCRKKGELFCIPVPPSEGGIEKDMSFFDTLALDIGRLWSVACNPLIVTLFFFCLCVTVYFQYRIYTKALPILGRVASSRSPLSLEARRQVRRLLESCGRWRTLLGIFIPLFPQAGILGTVSALLLELAESGGVGSGSDNIRFAMTSTLYGLVAAILLKIADIILMRFFDRVETGLEVPIQRKEG